MLDECRQITRREESRHESFLGARASGNAVGSVDKLLLRTATGGEMPFSSTSFVRPIYRTRTLLEILEKTDQRQNWNLSALQLLHPSPSPCVCRIRELSHGWSSWPVLGGSEQMSYHNVPFYAAR